MDCASATAHLQLVFKGGGQHVGEDLQGDWQEHLHEGHHKKDDERDESEDICYGPCQLFPLTPVNSSKHCETSAKLSRTELRFSLM